MGRLHLLELHEQPWFPAPLRCAFQDSLALTVTGFRAFRGAAAPLARLLEATGSDRVLDLCSGSALPVLDVVARAAARLGRPPPVVMLSDLYPNAATFARLKRQHPGRLDYVAAPLDALDVPADPSLPRVRTICTALHHFRPEQAQKILQSAVDHADGIAVLEPQSRSLQSLLTMPGVLVAMALASSFGLRPWRPWHLLWGLLAPVLPLAGYFDGVVSCLRSYEPDELRAMAASLDAPDFCWEAGPLPVAFGLSRGAYLVGWRQRPAPPPGPA